MKMNKIYKLLGMIALLLALTACFPPTDIISAEQFWSDKKPANYEFTLEGRLCSTPPDCLDAGTVQYSVQVKNGAVYQALDRHGNPVPPENVKYLSWPYTMDTIFDLINEELADPDRSDYADQLTESLTFNPQYGYIEESPYFTIISFTVN